MFRHISWQWVISFLAFSHLAPDYLLSAVDPGVKLNFYRDQSPADYESAKQVFLKEVCHLNILSWSATLINNFLSFKNMIQQVTTQDLHHQIPTEPLLVPREVPKIFLA